MAKRNAKSAVRKVKKAVKRTTKATESESSRQKKPRKQALPSQQRAATNLLNRLAKASAAKAKVSPVRTAAASVAAPAKPVAARKPPKPVSKQARIAAKINKAMSRPRMHLGGSVHKSVSSAFTKSEKSNLLSKSKGENLPFRRAAAMSIKEARAKGRKARKDASVRGTKALDHVRSMHFSRVANPVKGGISLKTKTGIRHYEPSPLKPGTKTVSVKVSKIKPGTFLQKKGQTSGPRYPVLGKFKVLG